MSGGTGLHGPSLHGAFLHGLVWGWACGERSGPPGLELARVAVARLDHEPAAAAAAAVGVSDRCVRKWRAERRAMAVQLPFRFLVSGMDPFSQGVLVGWCSGGTAEDRALRERFVRLVLGEKLSIKNAHRVMAADGMKVSQRTLFYWSGRLESVLAGRAACLKALGLGEEKPQTELEALGYQRVA